jgi:hypothetical protein
MQSVGARREKGHGSQEGKPWPQSREANASSRMSYRFLFQAEHTSKITAIPRSAETLIRLVELRQRMSRQCRVCHRLNPSEATFCFYDGVHLGNGAASAGGSIDFSTWAFPRPFVFPSGESCPTFPQLAIACRKDPHKTHEILRGGFLAHFFGGIGRVDLALAAGAAAKMPDAERAVDDLIGKLPGSPLEQAALAVQPAEVNLGVLPVGSDRRIELTLQNKGDRLLYGKVSGGDCRWLVFEGSGTSEKIFQCFDKTILSVIVVGKRLRAYGQPQSAELAIESNGGNLVVPVRVVVPVQPFPEGVLSGARSPRQVAEKAKIHPKEAAVMLEKGAVARWYEANGWSYPVKGPTATGIAAVQQFFETLGLVRTPKVDLSETAVTLRGQPGERIEYALSAITQEKRAAIAFAVSDRPWLQVGRTQFRGQTATVPLVVEAVPGPTGQTLTARLKVTANGNQHFDVPVTLMVGDGSASQPDPGTTRPAADWRAVPPPVVTPVAPPSPLDALTEAVTAAPPVVSTPPHPPTPFTTWLVRLLPLAIVAAGLLAALVRDLVQRSHG